MVKIYPQSVVGRYRTIKNRANIVLLLFYFLTPWLRWYRDENAPAQAIMIDLPTRRAYFFNIEIWPEEIFYIMTILIIAAFGLFLFTSILGRIWCGYTCPHTVFVDLFIKVEAFFQGSRNSRIALDKMPMNSSKLVKKLLTHLVWGGLSFLFAFGWICYFYDAPSFCYDLFLGHLGTASRSWLFGLTFTTYILAGFMREKVCTYICPYGRFQSAMLDNDSLIVTYHSWRGEPRLQKNTKLKNFGDCVDCYRCVAVCPMGIDIRDGLQMQCIGCGLCIDACDSVMSKLNQPLGLISYSSINLTEKLKKGLKAQVKLIRPKTVLYALLILIAATIILKSLLDKSMFVLSIERERGPLFTTLPDGDIRNTYNVYIANKALKVKDICLETRGVTNALIKSNMMHMGNTYQKKLCFPIEADSENRFKVFVKTKLDISVDSEKKFTFVVRDTESGKTEAIDSILISGKSM